MEMPWGAASAEVSAAPAGAGSLPSLVPRVSPVATRRSPFGAVHATAMLMITPTSKNKNPRVMNVLQIERCRSAISIVRQPLNRECEEAAALILPATPILRMCAQRPVAYARGSDVPRFIASFGFCAPPSPWPSPSIKGEGKAARAIGAFLLPRSQLPHRVQSAPPRPLPDAARCGLPTDTALCGCLLVSTLSASR